MSGAGAGRMTKGRFETLDGMRGVCALFIAIYHCGNAIRPGVVLDHAYLSVDAFFVVSGFVIAHVYENRLNAGFSMLAFLRARARRLLPTHWLGTSAVVLVPLAASVVGAVRMAHPAQFAASAALGLALIPNFVTAANLVFPINTPLWSLFDEWVINAAYARLLFAARTRILLAIVALAFAALAIYAFANPYGLCIGMRQSDFAFGIVKAVYGFIAGVVVFRAHTAGLLNRLPSLNPVIVYSLCFLAATIPAFTATPLFDLCAVALLPLLVALLVRSERHVPRPFLWLGAISYPLYVSQLAAINLASIMLGRGHHSIALIFPMSAAALMLAWAIERVTTRGGVRARAPAEAAAA